MLIKKATFVASYVSLDACPKAGLKEIAFIGRSNVGKSSLINMLCNNFHLAKTSSTPGKTQTLNYFLINEKFYFVDLPGYGWARVGRKQRVQFKEMISAYLKNRGELVCLFQLIDVSIKPQESDIEFSQKLAEWRVPFALVFTKSDKAGNADTKKNSAMFLNELKKTFHSLPPHFISSAKTRGGKEELLSYIENLV